MSNDSEAVKKTAVMILFIAALLLSVPFMWKLEVFLRAQHLLMVTVYALLAVYLTIVVFLFFRNTEKKLTPAIILIGYSILYALMIIRSRGFDKKIHFIEYGILTYLAYNAFAVCYSRWPRYILTFLVTVLVGFTDEALQHFFPGRSFDAKDFISNVEASALMLLLLYIVEKYRVSERDN